MKSEYLFSLSQQFYLEPLKKDNNIIYNLYIL